MAPVWSAFNRAIFGATKASSFVLVRGRGAATPQNVAQIRQMSEKFVIQPTRWQWHKFKDLLHLYTFAAVIPLGLISLYANVFIGPAELAPIPEGYVPQEHEYFRHPITRFFKKYVMESEQQAYEKHLHYCWDVVDQSEFRRIEQEVRDMQSSRGDYKFWYYLPTETHTYEAIQESAYESRQGAKKDF